MSTSSKPCIGFVGLGAMGFGMATHLVKQGYPVKGFDVFSKSLARFKAAGGSVASSLADSAQGNMYYICMVATAAQAQSALFDDEKAIVKALPKSATLLLCSTVPSAYAQSVQDQLKAMGREDIFFIDCPVSGGAKRAAEGTLSIMAGGSDAAIEKGRDFLAQMSDTKKLYIVQGGIGAGSNMKMVHQVLAGIHILAASEAMGLAARLGLDAQKVRDMIVKSEGWSWMYENRVPRMLVEDYVPGVSALTIIIKDVGIVTSTARLHNFPTPLSSTAEQVYLSGLSRGFGAEDDAGMVRMYHPDPISKSQANTTQNGSTSAGREGDTPGMRLVTQLLAGVHLCAAAEAIALAQHLGLDLAQFSELANDAAGGSWMFRDRGADMITGLGGDAAVWEKSPKRNLEVVVKDLSLVVLVARRVNFPVYLAIEALNLLLFAQRRGWGKSADASVVTVWERQERN